MSESPSHERRLQQALLSWENAAGPARFATELSGARSDKSVNVEYEFLEDRGRSRIRAHLDGIPTPLDEAVGLDPVAIAKPWGRELWFTGSEARGESRVTTESGSLPISAYLDLAPSLLCQGQPIVLLKILDPKPDPVLGELYLEAHASKHEIYVVTALDQTAWPDGVGAIRLGVNQALRRKFSSDQAFRDAYRAIVQAYERVRRDIDEGRLDGAAASADERRAREAMNRFTELLPLRVGDVVSVPPWLPHSLQHGVRVVEFQTPTYERFIISFPQRVVTQTHWDSDYAIARIDLEPPAAAATEAVAPGICEIANPGDFRAWRIELAPNQTLTLPLQLPYAVCIGLTGEVKVNGLARQAEQACFVPSSALPLALENPGAQRATALVASTPT